MMETGIIIRKSAIDARRELLGVPAVMSVLEPVEKAVFLASTSRPIADYEIAVLCKILNVTPGYLLGIEE